MLAPAATATGPADEPATVKNPPPTPPTTVTPTGTTMVSPLLTVVVAGGAVDVGAADETGGLVTDSEIVGGTEGGWLGVGVPEGMFVEGGREGRRLDEGKTEVPRLGEG